MKCPKCQYISFENGDRCRNCGYEFSLTPDTRALDLPIQTGDEPLGPLADFELESAASSALQDGVKPVDTVAAAPARPITSSFDLPLFKERKTNDDVPRVAATATPRPPLAVRRSTPVPPQPSSVAGERILGFTFDEPSEPEIRRSREPAAARATEPGDDATSTVASLGPRALAGVIDASILAAIAAIVLYLTLRICGVAVAQLSVIPPVPFAAFLLLIAGGYFTLFTAAGGQTIGKMAARIRVVPSDGEVGRVPLAHSVLRAVAYLVSALAVGLGFVPALIGSEKRAIHDRLADTRVVKA
jgi:uncharacterized RDD family membrane protein YckC